MGGVAAQHAVEKTFLVAQPVQPVALTSQVACCQSRIVSGSHNRRKPTEIARRDPPAGRSVEHRLAPTGTCGGTQGNSPTSHFSESPIKRRAGSKAGAGRAQSKKLRQSLAPASKQPLGSIPEHEQPGHRHFFLCFLWLHSHCLSCFCPWCLC